MQKVKQLNETKEYRISQRKRKLIEELFGEAKEYMGLRVSKFRRMKFVKEQVLMTAAAQNIKRMLKVLSGRGPFSTLPKQHSAEFSECFTQCFGIILMISSCI